MAKAARRRAATAAMAARELSSPLPTAAADNSSEAAQDRDSAAPSSLSYVLNDSSLPQVDSAEFAKSKMEGRRLRIKLRFFFMNPYDKFRITGQLPWKLIIQIVKIAVVTTQLILFGALRMEHVGFIEATETMLRHVVLKNWTDTRDVMSWPPAAGPYATYTHDGLVTAMSTAALQYYELNRTTFSSIDYMYPTHDANAKSQYPPLEVVYEKYEKAEFFPVNGTYVIDTQLRTVTGSIMMDAAQRYNVSKHPNDFVPILTEALGCNLTYSEMQTLTYKFNMQSIRMSPYSWDEKPVCFVVKVSVLFDNAQHTGIVSIALMADFDYALRCADAEHAFSDARITRATGSFVLAVCVDVVVFICCVLSLVLCGRALVRAELLKRRTAAHFRASLNYEMGGNERMDFVNLWYWMIVVNDILILVGTLFKMCIEYKYFNNEYFTAAGMFLGLGTLLVWAGVLRYLGFFPRYNVLILTLKRALPNVLRFLVCSAILYAGFMFCGWVVLGPYSAKFRTLFTTFANMYALINGDDMFATFVTLRKRTPSAITLFAKVYLVLFISLFMYVVLSLFISIIMDAYEVVKEHYDVTKEHDTFLNEFIRDTEADDGTPFSYERDHYDLPLDCDCTRTGCTQFIARLRPRTRDYEEIGGAGASTQTT